MTFQTQLLVYINEKLIVEVRTYFLNFGSKSDIAI